jgi:hypothetical protein
MFNFLSFSFPLLPATLEQRIHVIEHRLARLHRRVATLKEGLANGVYAKRHQVELARASLAKAEKRVRSEQGQLAHLKKKKRTFSFFVVKSSSLSIPNSSPIRFISTFVVIISTSVALDEQIALLRHRLSSLQHRVSVVKEGLAKGIYAKRGQEARAHKTLTKARQLIAEVKEKLRVLLAKSGTWKMNIELWLCFFDVEYVNLVNCLWFCHCDFVYCTDSFSVISSHPGPHSIFSAPVVAASLKHKLAEDAHRLQHLHDQAAKLTADLKSGMFSAKGIHHAKELLAKIQQRSRELKREVAATKQRLAKLLPLLPPPLVKVKTQTSAAAHHHQHTTQHKPATTAKPVHHTTHSHSHQHPAHAHQPQHQHQHHQVAKTKPTQAAAAQEDESDDDQDDDSGMIRILTFVNCSVFSISISSDESLIHAAAAVAVVIDVVDAVLFVRGCRFSLDRSQAAEAGSRLCCQDLEASSS